MTTEVNSPYLPWYPAFSHDTEITYDEWYDVFTWFVQKNIDSKYETMLDTKKELMYANKLYTEKFDSWPNQNSKNS
jgi:hypothetical protein